MVSVPALLWTVRHKGAAVRIELPGTRQLFSFAHHDPSAATPLSRPCPVQHPRAHLSLVSQTTIASTYRISRILAYGHPPTHFTLRPQTSVRPTHATFHRRIHTLVAALPASFATPIRFPGIGTRRSSLLSPHSPRLQQLAPTLGVPTNGLGVTHRFSRRISHLLPLARTLL